MPSQSSPSDILAPSISSSSSDAQSNDAVQPPKEPPRVYDLYSWSAKSPSTRLVYIQNANTANVAISGLKATVLGFDLEWRPNFIKGNPENPVALVQLASEDTILLIHLTYMSVFPEKLRELLLNPDVVKAGVGIQKDCKKLYTDYGVDTRNCVDLSLLARSVDNARWKGKYSNPVGLSRLLETYEEFSLLKGKVQISNWERPLDLKQQEYAANDCHAGLVLYERLAGMLSDVSPRPERFYYTFDTISGLLYQPSSGILWHPFNPYYDPGPPPPPRPPREPGAEGDYNHGTDRPQRGGRFRNQPRTRPPRPLSPTAPSFVPGAKEHSPSPSPSPHPGFAPRPRSIQAAPTPLDDPDGFPRLPRPAPRPTSRPAWQSQPPRHKSFRGGAPVLGPGRGQPSRGRGRGRGGYPMVAAPTG